MALTQRRAQNFPYKSHMFIRANTTHTHAKIQQKSHASPSPGSKILDLSLPTFSISLSCLNARSVSTLFSLTTQQQWEVSEVSIAPSLSQPHYLSFTQTSSFPLTVATKSGIFNDLLLKKKMEQKPQPYSQQRCC